jgi:hypothetical protein
VGIEADAQQEPDWWQPAMYIRPTGPDSPVVWVILSGQVEGYRVGGHCPLQNVHCTQLARATFKHVHYTISLPITGVDPLTGISYLVTNDKINWYQDVLLRNLNLAYVNGVESRLVFERWSDPLPSCHCYSFAMAYYDIWLYSQGARQSDPNNGIDTILLTDYMSIGQADAQLSDLEDLHPTDHMRWIAVAGTCPGCAGPRVYVTVEKGNAGGIYVAQFPEGRPIVGCIWRPMPGVSND